MDFGLGSWKFLQILINSYNLFDIWREDVANFLWPNIKEEKRIVHRDITSGAKN